MEVYNIIMSMVKGIVDYPDKVTITESDTDKGKLYEISADKEDIGKIIGKGGRVASAIRIVAKAVGVKHGDKILINVMKDPI